MTKRNLLCLIILPLFACHALAVFQVFAGDCCGIEGNCAEQDMSFQDQSCCDHTVCLDCFLNCCSHGHAFLSAFKANFAVPPKVSYDLLFSLSLISFLFIFLLEKPPKIAQIA